jgi:CheY-like chemotaxis protein
LRDLNATIGERGTLQPTGAKLREDLHTAGRVRHIGAPALRADGRQFHRRMNDAWTLLVHSESLSAPIDLCLAHRHGTESASESRADGSGSRHHRQTGSALIVAIDDDESVCRAVRTLLTSLGYDAAAFTSAESYLRSGLLETTACLIVDVHMPGLSGPDVQARLQADGHNIPIIFVTGSPDEAIRARVLEAGAIEYLTKPFNQQTLVAAITKALARQ